MIVATKADHLTCDDETPRGVNVLLRWLHIPARMIVGHHDLDGVSPQRRTKNMGQIKTDLRLDAFKRNIACNLPLLVEEEKIRAFVINFAKQVG
ncbi:MAG: hypothetical protein U9R64_13840 [Pseudomonadota bacterium]|nr:hypothetical protein [Pseudomonadota bacterium]